MKSKTHPLEQKIFRLRVRLRFLDIARAASWMTVAFVGGVAFLGAIDYWMRFQDVGMRVICTLCLLALLGWVCHRFCSGRFFGRRACKRLSSLNLAKSVEKTFPQLGDSLASTIEFLNQPQADPLAGSNSLRQAVITETTVKCKDLKFSASADQRPSLRAVLAATVACMLATAAVAINPLLVQVAVARLAYPLSDVSWPQKTHFKLVQCVQRIANGGTFEVEVTDAFGAKLPANVEIVYRFYEPDGSARQQSEPMRRLGHVMRAVRENITTAFAYRIIGGDDHFMEWLEVEVVEPPSVESLCVRLTPPDYTFWPAVTIDESHAGSFYALAGSRLRIEAAVNKPIESVQMHLGRQRVVPGRVSKNNMRFVVPAQSPNEDGLLVEHSDTFWFEITDREGFSGGGDLRWDIRTIEDRPPTVSIERPKATVYATPRATLPVEVLIEDDLAIRRVELIARLKGCDDEKNVPDRLQRKIVLFEAQQQSEQPRPSAAEQGESRRIKYRWNLGNFPLKGRRLKPGCTVVFRIAAEDYKPLTGKSDTRKLVIVSTDEMLERIAVRQQTILAELARVLAMQRQCRRQVSELVIRLQEAGRLAPADLDRLRRAELAQREVSQALADRNESVRQQIFHLLESLENNHLDRPEVQQRLSNVMAEIDRLQKHLLGVISTQMTAAVKSVQAEGLAETTDNTQKAVVDTATLDTLKDVEHGQVVASRTLERLLGRLSQWDDYRRFHRQLAQLTGNQEALLGRSVRLAGRTLAKSPAELGPQETAELRVAAADQSRLARHLARITHALSQMAGKLEDNDPDSAAKIGDAMHCIVRRAIAARMRSADDNLRRNRIAQAVAEQRQIIDDLQAAVSAIDGRRKNSQHSDELAEMTDNFEPRRQKSPVTQQARQNVSGQQSLVQSQKSRQGQKPQPGASPGDSGPGADVQPTDDGRGPEAEQFRLLIKQLWGELPPRNRDRLLQYPVEEFLPQYESMIEAYYKRLSEDDDSS